MPIIEIITAASGRDEEERKRLSVVETWTRSVFLNTQLCIYEMAVMMLYGRIVKCTFD